MSYAEFEYYGEEFSDELSPPPPSEPTAKHFPEYKE